MSAFRRPDRRVADPLLGLLLSACLLSGCSKTEENKQATPEKTTASTPAAAQPARAEVTAPLAQTMPATPPRSGRVVESKQVGSYTFVLVETDGARYWLATNPFKPAVGDLLHWEGITHQKNYYNKTLNQTFPLMLFVNALQTGPIPAATAVSGTQNKGRVHAVLQSSGYTYLQIDSANGFWIAAPNIRVKEGDTALWGQGTLLKNFTSKTLNRTFDEIHFLGSIQVEPVSPPPKAPNQQADKQQPQLQRAAPQQETRDPAVRRKESGKPVQKPAEGKTPPQKPAPAKVPPERQ
ncbi:MAG: hypothetical protein HQL91_11340 [Magnetococcales bacterium]|nr:hypothetical protein [Magnetococcales bacterium]